jgi:FtsP/CotA-like multicopper oxidase with cupredoxin domain
MTSRREVLRRLGIGAGAIALGTRVSGGETSDPPARTIRIEAREVTWELAPGRTVKAMAYNGRIPGPEIRVREGERVRVVLSNALAEPTTIHWHGVDVPNAMDGVAGLTQEPVAPGSTFVYEFEARPAGTRWYHTHFAEHRQLDLGLAAPFIVEPRAAEPVTYDRELTLVLDDWATGHGKPIPSTAGGTGGGGMMGGMMRGMGGMMGGRPSAGHAEYDTMTINGKVYPATEPLRVKKGERVRLRVISASAEHTHLLRVAGHRLHVTHTDGNPLVKPVEVDALPVAPAERYDAVLVAERPGAWLLQCLAAGHADAGEKMAVLYDGHERKTPAAPQERVDDLHVWDHELGRGRPVLLEPTGATRRFDLTLSGGMMGSDVWTINRKTYPNTDPLPLRRGDRAIVRFNNMSPDAHPMHLHGQSFRVLAVNGVRYAEPVVKDTVDVRAHMGSAVVEFTAHNPGDWFFHCHKPSHMDGGMIAVVKIASA